MATGATDSQSEVIEISVPQQGGQLTLQQCTESVLSLAPDRHVFSSKAIQYFMKKKHVGSVLQIRTRLGYTLRVTPEHPILTKKGMTPAEKLAQAQEIAIYPFEGVQHEPIDEALPLVDEASFTKL